MDILDEIDFKIIRELKDKEITTTWLMAKKFYASEIPKDTREKEKFLGKKDAFIRGRMECMARWGIVNITKEGYKNVYGLQKEIVFLAKHKFLNKKIHNSIHVLTNTGRWVIFQV